mgnify:CR=1 FL=1
MLEIAVVRTGQALFNASWPLMNKSMLVIAAIRSVFRTVPQFGFCPVCEGKSVFFALGPWLREDLKCVRCKSSSRQRALIDYIGHAIPMLGEAHVYEPSPTQPTIDYLERHSGRYTSSQYSPDEEGRNPQNPFNQDLQALRFPDNAFDLVVSQDVFEHIAEPRKAFAEVARVLKPGGSHIFTVPWYRGQLTETRARIVDGEVMNLHPPEYHSDPNTRDGALVFTRFGSDIEEMISDSSGMKTSVIDINDAGKGITGDSIQIFHSTSPGGPHRQPGAGLR